MKKICWWQISLRSLLFLFPLISNGQEEILYFHRLTSDQNLTSQSYNYYIFKDSEGFVWISSINGLNRYDGRKVKQYVADAKDTFSIADNNIHSAFFEDENKNLWFSTNQAVHRYDRENDGFQKYYIKENEQNAEGEYQLLLLDTIAKRLWIRIDDKLFTKSFVNSDKQDYLGMFPLNHRAKIEKAKNSSDFFLIIPDTLGLQIHLFRDYKEIPLPGNLKPKRLAGAKVLTCYFENEEALWVGTDQGLFQLNLNNNDSKLYNDFYGIPVTEVSCIAPLGEDKLIIATQKNQVFYFDKLRQNFAQQLYAYEEGTILPFRQPVDNIYVDQDDNLWITATGRGAYFTNLKKKKFKAFLQKHADSSSNESNIRSMCEDNFGRIWCLTRNGITILSLNEEGDTTTRLERITQNLPLIKDEPYYIYCDRSGRIWVCTESGIYVGSSLAKIFTKMKVEPTPKESGFTFINQLSTGKILASSQSDGVFEVDERNGTPVLRPFQELTNNPGEFTWNYEDSKNRVYFCKNNSSISIFHRGNEFLYADTTIALKPMVNAIVEDNSHQFLWIATTEGLFRLEASNNSYTLQQDTLLTLQTLNGLLQDEQGALWISSNNGLIKWLPTEKKWRTYKIADGLQSSEFNFWSFIKTSKRLFGFGGVNGINFFHPADVNDLQIEARPIITEILINDTPGNDYIFRETKIRNISLVKQLVLPYRKNTISFRFAPREYGDPSSNQFSFQLKNYDDTLVNIGTENFARYPNLRPGNYVFEVHATNSDGVWSQQIASIQIRIKPPWYRTALFRILLLLLSVIIIYAIYRVRINQIKRKEAFLRIVAETETAVLRLQMNPHFIFNSMNSISSYILQKDIDTANDYLNRFAKLMRMILKFAEKPLISISEEIELLEQYLQTEAMRMEKKFTYTIEVSPELDPDEVLLPTMILQPFVENAIWHGISPKATEGHIRIYFGKEMDQLLCSIEDDGIGRAAASALKESAKSHESKALSITARRLQLLENMSGKSGSFEIIDLQDEKGNPAGTKVILRLPFL